MNHKVVNLAKLKKKNALGISRGIQSWRSQAKRLRRRSELGGELNLLLSRV